MKNLEYYSKGIFDNNRTILAQAITLLESRNRKDYELADAVLRSCLKHKKPSIRLGITGHPGVGKSTFIECFGEYLIQKHNRRIAVLAIDPSSYYSKGSILGDKTRMEKLAVNPHAFVRPSPSSGSLGGVTFRTREVISICEAAGYDTILIETLGSGQAQFEVHSMVDMLLLLVTTKGGDILQGIKRGIMEMLDLVLVTKADGENIKQAELARQEYQTALGFHSHHEKANQNSPPALSCSALEVTGMDDIEMNIQSFVNESKHNGYFDTKRKRQMITWAQERIKEEMGLITESICEGIKKEDAILKWGEQIQNGEITPVGLGQKALENFSKNFSKKGSLAKS